MSKVHSGYRSKLEWVLIASLEIEPTAQRPLRESHVKKIAAQFNRKKVGHPIVAELADGRRIIVDGQHRIAAMRLLFGAQCLVECEVVRGVTLAEAADMFRAHNTILRPRPVDDFLAGVTAEDPECIAINEIVQSHGLHIGQATMARTLSAVVKLRRIFQTQKSLGDKAPNLLSRTLALSMSAWGREPEALHGDILEGIALFLARYGGAIELDALENKLRQFNGGALGVLGKARGIRGGLGGSIVVNIARVILTTYNAGRRKNLLPEWGAHMGEAKTASKKAA